jgi:spore coat protein U-like protein
MSSIKKLKVINILKIILFNILFSSAYAAKHSADIGVSASVVPSCSVALSSLDFGDYILENTLPGTTILSITCTNGTPYTISIDKGMGIGATLTNRLLTRSGSSETLQYNLYQDALHTIVWGDNTGERVLNEVGTGSVKTFTLYGFIQANQKAPAGNYYDSLTVTVTY